MKNKQEIWFTMIISAFSKKLSISITEAVKQLLACKCFIYLEEHYNTLHLLSNDDVIDELIEITGVMSS